MAGAVITTLNDLAAYLKGQATPAGQITLDCLSGRIEALFGQALGAGGPLTFAAVDAAAIPANPGATLTIACTTPDDDTQSFLNLSGAAVALDFAVLTAGGTSEVNLTMRVSLPAGWKPSDSYLDLIGLVTDSLPLVNPAAPSSPPPQYLLFSSYPAGYFDPAQGGQTYSDDLVTPGIPLNQGTNYYAQIGLSGLLAVIVRLLSSSAAPAYQLYGPLTRGQHGTELDLTAPLTSATLNPFGFLAVSNPRAGVRVSRVQVLDSGEDEEGGGGGATALVAADPAWVASPQLYLATDITIGTPPSTIPLILEAALPLDGGSNPILSLSLTAADQVVTLSDLVGLLYSTDGWDDLFAQSSFAEDFKTNYLDTFGLKSFVAGFQPSLGAQDALGTVQVNLGTMKPWPVVDDLSLSFDIRWTISSPLDSDLRAMAVFVEGDFTFKDKIAFAITASIPDLIFIGQYFGPPLSFSLQDLGVMLFGSGGLVIPAGLAQFSFGGFFIMINGPAHSYTFAAVVDVTIGAGMLFGSSILSLSDTSVMFNVSAPPNQPTAITAKINGTLSLGTIKFQVDATLSNDPKTHTVFELHLIDETIGTMLNHLVHLVDPDYDLSFDAPWDKLLDISLDALVLTVDLTAKSVNLTYNSPINLWFVEIDSITLTYQKSDTTASSVEVSFTGKFLGKPLDAPLAWDAINQSPPAVPGGGTALLDLQYLGLGQHIAFAGTSALTTVEAVMAALQQSVIPTGNGQIPALGSQGLQFSKDSNWLIGAQFTVMGTVSLSVIFNDPNLYGLLISLGGPRAKSFAGLKVEILYRKVTDTIGVYHIELKLPDAMRNLQFGEVSVTLPVVVLDIYTNGNFRIDLGFPNGLDFSNSFALQIFPFAGYGGFYFALLNGQTSSRVPQIDNGNFSPVIEFGIGLSIGVGKTIDEGMLSAGISVTVVGILEGVVGWFNPDSSAVAKEEYYWIKGMIAIVGKLYGTIDFKIIKASVEVVAYASATLVIEAHQPIYISLVAGVSVKVSIKVVFFTIHLSFSAQIKASFTIGSATPTPWHVVAPPSGGATAARLAAAAPTDGQPRTAPAAPRFAGLAAAVRRDQAIALAAAAPAAGWTAAAVFPGGATQAIDLYAVPAFTKSAGGNGVEAVLLFLVENATDPRAVTHADHRQLYGASPAAAEFNLLLEGMLRWAVYAATGQTGDGTAVTADALALLKQQLTQTAIASASFNYANLQTFLGQNFIITVQPPPVSGNDLGGAVFPAMPALTLASNDSNNVNVNFATFPPLIDGTYEAAIDAYFAQLEVQYMQGVAAGGAAPVPAGIIDSTPVSMATVLFEQYFAMLAGAVVQAAGDALAQFALTQPGACGMSAVRTAIGDPTLTAVQIATANQNATTVLNTGQALPLSNVLYQSRQGDSFATIAAAFAKVGATAAGGGQLQAAGLLAANATTPSMFTPGTFVTYSNLAYQTQVGDSINLIAARLLLRAQATTVLQQIAGLTPFAQLIEAANPGATFAADGTLTPAQALVIPGGATPYTTVAGDTFTLVAGYLLVQEQGAVNAGGLTGAILAANPSLPVTNPTQPQPPNTPVTIPSLTRAMQTGDTMATIATALLTTEAIVQAGLLAVPATVNLLAPLAVLTLPALGYVIQAGDTLAGIAARFNLTVAQLAADLDDTPAAPLPLFAADAAITVNNVGTATLGALIGTLLGQGEWNNISGMVSRFLLSGLRLPNPADPSYTSLTPQQWLDPRALATVATAPLYALTGQQFAIVAPPAAGYALTLTNSGGADWLSFSMAEYATKPGDTLQGIAQRFIPAAQQAQFEQDLTAANPSVDFSGPLTAGTLLSIPPGYQLTELQFGLSADQVTLIDELAATALTPSVESLTRLALYQMTPARTALQQHIQWQAAVPPALACSAPVAQAAGGPGLWPFPDALVTRLATAAAPLQYELVVGTHQDATAPIVTAGAGCYTWATVLNLTIGRLPVEGTPPAAVANGVALVGADQDGQDLLQAVYQHLTATGDSASLYLLYAPNPGSAAPSGLVSDPLDPTATYLLKTNLSTLTQSGPVTGLLTAGLGGAPAPVHGAALSAAPDFLRLLWEASLAGGAGYYLNYVKSSGASLPATLFSKGDTATITLLIVLSSQNVAYPPLYSFNNAAVLGDNIDLSTASVFAQPAVYVVPQGASLASAAAWYNATHAGSLTVAQLADLNGGTTNLLLAGATLAVGGYVQPYTIGATDTLTSIAARFGTTVDALIATAGNSAAPILTRGATATFAAGPPAVTATIPAGASLTDAAAWYNAAYGGSQTAATVAALNAGVKALLLMGGALANPAGGSHTIAYGDTLTGIAAALDTTVAALVAFGGNAAAPVLAPGGQAQFAAGVLQPVATVPAGVNGFELVRPNPDPTNLPYQQMTAAQNVAALFHLLGFQMTAGGGFSGSGEGLPVTPSQSDQAGSNGLNPNDLQDSIALNWTYQRQLAVAPFATAMQGSVSPALPPATANPYNGVAATSAVTLSFQFQDIYGNQQPADASYASLALPVRYYDDLIDPSRWPSLAAAYQVVSGPAVQIALTMHLDKYLPSPSISVAAATRAAAADLARYTQIYYQLAQSDLGFALETALDPTSLNSVPPVYPIAPAAPLSGFVNAAAIFLGAAQSVQQVDYTLAQPETLTALTARFGVSGGQLLDANGGALYRALFGGVVLQTPVMYVSGQNDTLATIGVAEGIDPLTLAIQNAAVALNAGIDITTPNRPYTTHTGDSLQRIAQAWRCTVAGIVQANHDTQGIIAQSVSFTAGGQTCTTGATDSFDTIVEAFAAKGVTVTLAELALANQWTAGVFVESVALTITDLIAAAGDSLSSLSAAYAADGFTVSALAGANSGTPNLYAPGTALFIKLEAPLHPPATGDTLAAFALNNGVTPDELAQYNGTATVVAGAALAIPYLVSYNTAGGYSTYVAGRSDTLGGIAAKYPNTPAAALAALNQDIEGLLAPGQPITAPGGSQQVTTTPASTFHSLLAAFAALGVTLTLDQLAQAIAPLPDLVQVGGVWLCPPISAATPGNSLAGLAGVYGIDPVTLATANAAVQGVIAAGAPVHYPGAQPLTATAYDSFNSLVARLAAQGVQTTVAQLATAVQSTPGLINPTAAVLPPPAATSITVPITPRFATPIFPLSVDLVMRRDPALIDPDFVGVTSVQTARTPIAPVVDPAAGSAADAPLSLTAFAAAFETVFPGLHVATGAAMAEFDPATARRLWVVNFGSLIGQPVSYQFQGGATQYYGLPPLSTALISGSAPIQPYVSGTGLSGPAQPTTFQSIDLDSWAQTFLAAVDQLLSPAYALPAYSSDPAHAGFEAVVAAKAALAAAIKARVQPILGSGGAAAAPEVVSEALEQALLVQLSAAYSITSLIETPVAVTSGYTDPAGAPRLSGKATIQPQTPGGDVKDFSLSTAKVPLTNGGESAVFLFTAKSPADNKQADLVLQYVVNELEIPESGTPAIDGYQPSHWLTFVRPLADAASLIGPVTVPVPLRSYPAPITLVDQTAVQTIARPASAADLVQWSFAFTYQHIDADQDTTTLNIEVTVAGAAPRLMRAAATGESLFEALAQFIAIYPALQAELALLPALPPAATNPTAVTALNTFAALAGRVAAAWPAWQMQTGPGGSAAGGYNFAMAQTRSGSPPDETLTTLTLTADSNNPTAPSLPWPLCEVAVTGGAFAQLTAGQQTATTATYSYPAGVPAGAPLQHRFSFPSLNVTLVQDGWAGVYVTRNAALVNSGPTNPAFVYQTPIVRFSGAAVPSISGGEPIDITAAPGTPLTEALLAQSLGRFFQALFAGAAAAGPRTLRVAASYGYELAAPAVAGTRTAARAAAGGNNAGDALVAYVPVNLIPSYRFDPASSWDWTSSGSFVSQLAAAVWGWGAQYAPAALNGAYYFDVSLYSTAAGVNEQPLIEARFLKVSLT